MIQVAYDLSADRILGPNWLADDHYDLAAKSPAGVPDSALMPMLQAMLAERFRLSCHRESKEMALYEMTVAKEGLKMSLFDPAHPPTPPRVRGGALIMGTGTMPQFAKMIARSAGRPVIDKTGLDGRYTYVLSFTPLAAQSPDQAADAGPPDIFSALQLQLGLKLEGKKGPVEFLVIDHVERTPVEN
jgi:uncharacterized protein (TIGR03435 family)